MRTSSKPSPFTPPALATRQPKAAMVWSLSGKDRGHHFLEPEEHEHERVGMSLIGG